jgi:putative ABC transport system permease protein
MSIRRFFQRRRSDEELRREMEQHLAFEHDVNISRGMAPEEASRRAHIKFGSQQRVREDLWKNNSITLLESLLRDLRYAVRTLLRSPGYTMMAILTLGLGIGANTAIFTVINGVLLRPLPYANPNQVVHLQQTAARVGADPIGFSVQEVQDYRDQSRAFSDLAEYHSMTFTLLGAKVPERVVTGVVSANYFNVLGIKPILGRLITPADENLSAPPVLVLSYAYWMKEFGGDPKVLGRPFTMNDRVHTVVGVMPPLPEYPDANDVYMPTTSCPFRSSPGMINNRDARVLTILARLKPGTTAAQAQSDLATITHRLALAYPKSYPSAAGFAVQVNPVDRELTHAARPTFLMLLAAAGLVLLLACANLANLALSRQLRRTRETAIRMASGANAWDIFRQLLTESMVVAGAGGVLGIVIAAIGSKLLIAYAARMTPLAGDIHLDGRVLLFGAVLSLLTGVLFGAFPGFAASRSKLNILAGSGDKAAGSEGGTRTRNTLVAAQVAFSFVLLMCAGLMMRSLYNLLSVDPGFKPANVLSMNLSLNWTKYAEQTTQNTFFHQILDRAQQIPGTQSVALSSIVPLNRDSGGMNAGISFEGRALPPGEPLPRVDYELATPDYFRVLGVPMLQGRSFTDADTRDSTRVAIVNAQMAKHYWPKENPIGHRVSEDNGKTWTTIVGVVSNVHQYGVDKDFVDGIYFPQGQSIFMGDPHLLIRTRNDPDQVAHQIVSIIQQIDPQQPVTDIHTLDQLRSKQLGTPRVTSLLLGLFAAVALFITVVGVTGTLGLSVARRTKEIGIRIALGATKQEILQNVLARGMAPVIAGIIAGAAAAILSTRLLASMLFAIEPNDPPTFIAITTLLGLVAFVGCVIPARRAIRVDPVKALRTE